MRSTGEQTDVAIEGDGYFMIENKLGKLGMSRRGDFTISTDGYFFIIEKNTGNILRITNVFNNLKKKKNKEFYPTGFVFNFQNLFISTNNGKLIVTDIKTGKIKNILNVDNDIISRPIVQNQSMYLIKDSSIVKLN